MLTPRDLLNTSRISGYDHVGKNDSTKNGTAPKPFQADVYGGKNDTAGRRWKGPRRATAAEAAQDYCDYVNGQPAGFVLNVKNNLKSAGHTAKRASLPSDPEVEYALGVLRDFKGQQQGKQGYVYMIAEAGIDGLALLGTTTYCKIGFSTNPEARVTELQTGNPRKLVLVGKIKGTLEDEATMHKRYINRNVLQEWFWMSFAMLSEFVPSEPGAQLSMPVVPSDGEAKVAA